MNARENESNLWIRFEWCAWIFVAFLVVGYIVGIIVDNSLTDVMYEKMMSNH